MGLKRGFEATVQVKVGNEYKNLLTHGDVTYETSNTEIEIKNAAADEVRYLAGMGATNFQMTVQAGTDPEDDDSFDGYATLYQLFTNKTTFEMKFTSPGGFTQEKAFIITNWSDSNAVDGLNEATVTFRVSAADVGTVAVSGGGNG